MPRIHVTLGTFTLAATLCACAQVFGQIPSPTEEELAEVKRKHELLRHPTFATLRLVSAPRDVPREAPTDTPAAYKVNDYIAFELFMTQNSSDKFTIWTANSCFHCRPELTKDGESVPYNKRMQKVIESQQPENEFRGSGVPVTYEPGREYGVERIDLSHWYEPLEPGRYQLIVRRRFIWDGDWVVSNPVYFDVIPEPIPAAIPEGVKIEIVPEGANLNQKINNISGDTILQVFTRNTSGQPVKVTTVDFFYSVRPQLFKDKVLIPYLADTANLVKSREEDPRLSQLRDEIFLAPGSRTGLTYLRLGVWYDSLSPGLYRLSVRQRFEIDGPWTAESAPLFFEIEPSKAKSH